MISINHGTDTWTISYIVKATWYNLLDSSSFSRREVLLQFTAKLFSFRCPLLSIVEKISECYLIPVLEQLLDQFPFIILGFHADNGSEYINQHGVKLLKKLLIELTKSRARHSNDNALVESKNGSIIKKHLGYSHIRQHLAPVVNQFHQDYLNPYINYHRPCFFPVTKTNAKGKQVKTYPYEAMMTPYEKFKSLGQPSQHLKPDITMNQLDAIAFSINDNEAAKQLKVAKQQLFKTVTEQNHQAA